MPARFRIPNHPTFGGPLSKEDLYVLVERGSLARGDICLDTHTGRSHKIGELIDGMPPPRSGDPGLRIERPAYQEIRADFLSMENDSPEDEDSDENEEDEFDQEDYETTPDGEHIHYRDHPSWMCYAKSLLLFVLLGVASGLAFQFDPKYLVIGSALAALTFAGILVARFSRVYTVTDERVEVLWGILGRSSKEVRIRDIRSIDVRKEGLSGALGIGDVDFSSASTSGVEVQFKGVRGAHRVKELVRQLQKET